VTHRAENALKQKCGTFYFVAEGVEAAVKQAKNTAGSRKVKGNGCQIARQVLALRLADRIELRLSPVLLYGGARLFNGLSEAGLRPTLLGQVVSTSVVHLTFGVARR
jgi:dihydrofolate reductase